MGYRDDCFKEYGRECWLCQNPADIAHHVNGDRDDGDIENLRPVCHTCHASIHGGAAGYEEWTEQLPESALTVSGRGGLPETTITIPKAVKEVIEEQKPDGQTWSQFLERRIIHEAEPEEMELTQRDINRLREAVRTEVRDTLESLARH